MRRGRKVQKSSDVADPQKATFERAIRLLTVKPRSVAELRERLLQSRQTNERIVETVIARLSEYGYLDDERFASDLALSKLRQRPQGKRSLQQKLSRKKLDREVLDKAIESAFEKIPESDLIDTAIEKRLRLKGRPETREDTKRFLDHLLRLGFDYDLIREKMSAIKTLD